MKWTKERPKESGWYWIDEDGIITIVWVQFWFPKKADVYFIDFGECRKFEINEIYEYENPLWSGPIPEPED